MEELIRIINNKKLERDNLMKAAMEIADEINNSCDLDFAVVQDGQSLSITSKRLGIGKKFDFQEITSASKEGGISSKEYMIHVMNRTI